MFRITKKTMALVAVCVLAMLSALSQTANPASDFDYDLADDNVSVIITKYKGNAKNVVIPSSIEGLPVSTLGARAFYENKTIESVVMPDTIKLIKDECFYRCSNLKSVVISKNVKRIPKECFRYCTSLENIVLPDGLEEIGHVAFAYSSALKTIKLPDTVKYIEYNEGNYGNEGAFFESGLTHIELPDALTEIPIGAFANCKSLVSVKFGKNMKMIRGDRYRPGAFQGCTSLEKIELPETIETVGEAAFSGCSKLSEIVIPESVDRIEFREFVINIYGERDYDHYDRKHEETFSGTNFNLATKAKLRALGYKGEF